MMDSGQGDLPAALPAPVPAHARNNEHNLDLAGRCTHLDERDLVVTFPMEIPEATVLFTNIHLGQTVVRGLTRVRSQWPAGDLGGYRTLLEFVDLVDGERRKIVRELGGSGGDAEPVGADGERLQTASHTGGFVQAPSARPPQRRRWQIRLPMLRLPSITLGNVIWFLLGVVFYSTLVLGVVALFPKGLSFELAMLHRIELWFQSMVRLWNHFLATH